MVVPEGCPKYYSKMVGRPMVLPTDQHRHLILHVMAKVWGILLPREFQVRAIAQLIF
jgi:hypothetical protein